MVSGVQAAAILRSAIGRVDSSFCGHKISVQRNPPHDNDAHRHNNSLERRNCSPIVSNRHNIEDYIFRLRFTTPAARNHSRNIYLVSSLLKRRKRPTAFTHCFE
ncbi:hypothetical protein AB1N83_013510 [Pleurotus pulmonarius]